MALSLPAASYLPPDAASDEEDLKLICCNIVGADAATWNTSSLKAALDEAHIIGATDMCLLQDKDLEELEHPSGTGPGTTALCYC